MSDESQLNELFAQYRSACPDVEPSANFMPVLWQKIDSRRGFWFNFGRLGKNAVSISAALCLVLLAMNLGTPAEVGESYTDALISESSSEQVYYSEAARPALPEQELPVRH